MKPDRGAGPGAPLRWRRRGPGRLPVPDLLAVHDLLEDGRRRSSPSRRSGGRRRSSSSNYLVLFTRRRRQDRRQQPGHRPASAPWSPCSSARSAPTRSRASAPAATTSPCGSLSNRMLPPIVIVFPVFLLYVWLGWVDTYLGLILLYTAFNLPYVIWMMRGYIQDIPLELEESALVDGCTPLARVLQGGAADGPQRPLRHRRLHLRLRLERVPVRAGPDPERGHHLPGPGHPLLRRPVQFLGQDRRHERARHACRSSSPWRCCSATWCAASRWARSRADPWRA